MDFQASGKDGGTNGEGHEGLGDMSAADANFAQGSAAAASAGLGQRVIAQPGQQNTVMLPAGVTINDLEVSGDNIVVRLPDGTMITVVDAVLYDVDFVIAGTTVPDENWKDYLGVEVPIDPEGGNAQSSGGNFADAVNPIDPAYAIGDLLPYTELQFTQADDPEVFPGPINGLPEVTSVPNIAESDAGTIVDEDGLPAREGDMGDEPAGTDSASNDESTVGVINFVSPDGVDQLLIDGEPVFEIVDGELVIIFEPTPLGNGILTVVDVDLDAGTITYDYTLTDNTISDGNTVDFDITVVDPDGDSDTGNVVISIIDDTPITTDDGNLATLPDEAAGIVVGTLEQIWANDDFGADGMGTPAIDIGSGDQGGTIAIVDGELVYTAGGDALPGETLVETFTYTITDGDGSVSNTATFTVTLTENGPALDAEAASILVDEDGLPGGIAGGEGDLTGETITASGMLSGLDFGGDGAGDIVLAAEADTGLVTLAGNAVETVWDAATHTLTGQDAVTGEAVFTLTITDTATGAYEFNLLSPVSHPGADEDDATLSIDVTVTDSDGDAVTGAISVIIDDDSPIITLTGAEAGMAVLDESPLAADGIASASVDFSGSFTSAFGADGAGAVDYTLSLTGSDVGSGLYALNGTQIVLNLADGVITGSADGTDYFTISVEAGGVVTFAFTDAYANIAHDDTTSADDAASLLIEGGALSLVATVTDADGDTASASVDLGTGTFAIEDDGPAIDVSAMGEAGYTATTSDGAITESDGFDLSAIFAATGDYGTDGAGSTTGTYGLALLSPASGLTSGGEAITLTIDGDTVTGATASSTVFTVTVNAETGSLTLTQEAVIDHAEGSDSVALADGLIAATFAATITDADGDSASADASFDLGGNLVFTDDLPTIVATGDIASAVLDESPVSDDGISSVTVDYSGNFTTDNGNDAPGSVTYALSLSGSDAGSGLYTLDGTEIVLNIAGGVITGSADGTDYFTISVDASGSVTFAFTGDYANITNGDATSNDDPAALMAGTGVLTLVATATDSDFDSASAAIDLGNGTFVIEDDGPTAADDGAFMVDEDQTLSDIDVFGNDDAGTDGVDLATGITIVTDAAKGTVTYNGDGTFDYTPDAGASGDDSFTYSITDADGDTSTATVSLTIAPDSVPVIRSIDDATVDEDGLVGANADDGQTDPAETTSTGLATVTGTIVVDFGADVPADPMAAFSFDNVDALDGSITSDGQPVDFALDGDGNIVGTVDGGATNVITIALTDASAPSGGSVSYIYTVTLSQPVDHPAAGSEDSVTIAGISFTVADSDVIDTVSGSFDATIVDDVPSADAVLDGAPVLTVDDTTLGVDASADFAGAFTIVAGADGADSVTYVLGVSAAGADSGLTDTASGEAILLYVEGGEVVGRVGGESGDIAFTVSVDATGTVTLDQLRAIYHSGPADPIESGDAAETLSSADLITLTATVTDGDGDMASDTLNIGQSLMFEDDGPAITADAAIDAGMAMTSDATLPDSDATSLDLSAVFGFSGADYGEDGAGSTTESYSLSLLVAEGSPSGLTSGGEAIVLSVYGDGSVVTGSTGEGTVFTITVAADGTLTLDQLATVDHAMGSDLATLADGLVQADYSVTITDGDGDSVTQTANIDLGGNIAFGDDTPTITATGGAIAATLDESPLPADGDGIASVTVDYSGSFSGDYGADGAGSTTYALTLNGSDVASGVYALSDTGTGMGEEIVLNLVGGEIVGTAGGQAYFAISVSADGMVNFSQSANVWHGDTGSDDDAVSILLADGTMGLTATITDFDTDSASDTIDLSGGVFSIQDDGPSLTVSAMDDDSEQAATDDDGSPNVDTLQLSAIFATTSFDYGTDGAAASGGLSETYALNIAAAYDAGTGTTLTSGGATIYLYEIGNTVIGATAATYGELASANTVFVVDVNTSTGEVGLQQYAPLDHATGTDSLSLPTGLIEASYDVIVTDGDGDTVSDDASIDLGGNLVFNDDAPAIEATGTPAVALLDESPLPDAGDGVTHVPYDGIREVSVDYSANFNVTASADTPNAVAYALQLSADGVGSGLYALDNTDVTDGDGDGIGQGTEILLSMDGGDVVGTANGTEYFRIALDEATGVVTFSQSENIWHDEPGFWNFMDEGVSISMPEGTLTLEATVTDSDNDVASALIDLSDGAFTIEDDGPSVWTKTKYTPFEMSGTTEYALIANGDLDFDFGTDGPLGGSLGTGMTFELLSTSSVDSIPLTSISQPVYNPVSDSWQFSFEYTTSTGTSGSNAGEITYDGDAWTLTLDDNFEFSAILAQSDATVRTGYDAPGMTGGQTEIVVSKLDIGDGDPIYVQFRGYNGTLTAGGDNAFAAGDEVGGTQTWVSITNEENGVAGDTIQDGEVLDFDFYSFDPKQYDKVQDSFVSGMTLSLDGVGANEDLIVILKLADPGDPTNIITTRAVVVGSDDIYRNGDAIPDGYGAPTLDNNDGFVIIEGNDYLEDGEAYVIVGAQLMVSSSGLTGSGIDLNGAVGDDGGSTGTVAFGAATDDNDVIKISDIGLIRTVIDQSAVSLDIRATATDADGDSYYYDFHINPFSDPVVLDLDGNGIAFQSLDAGVTYDMNGDGIADATSWISAGDAILIHDLNGNGAVDDAGEFIFHDDGMTDLETLAAIYGDTLDANDADYAQFGVWADDGDGVFEAGEYMTLAEAGITDIQLTSDGEAYAVDGGEVQVLGTGSFNGGTGTLVDAAFRTQYGTEQQRTAEMATIAALAPALLETAAAQATTSFAAPEMVNFDETPLLTQQFTKFSAFDGGDFTAADLPTLDTASHVENAMPQSSLATAAADAGLETALTASNEPAAVEAADLGASSDAAADFSGAGAMTAQMMEAMLDLTAAPAPAEGAQGMQALDAVREALAEVTGEDDISALVQQIVDTAGVETHGAADHAIAAHGAHPIAAADIAALLGGEIAGAGHGAAMQMTDGADEAALAAAVAH
ncbi:DUF5801 repeats-in-toxin domain-containing protein [Croceicoccus mobilis]|uniref:DUF5801 domain-containing protein n=1 Tax=Croceicoccus mobilis TaxID=1703339 RepID=A0A916Z2Y2_9SPHN|nr:DUF5801 repeats-in-toxin domain-containing protein [Croceicoccus mobilis]GGD73717.1 hypothetical protein GCM10010990_24150 [Croceicoccus mobilis]